MSDEQPTAADVKSIDDAGSVGDEFSDVTQDAATGHAVSIKDTPCEKRDQNDDSMTSREPDISIASTEPRPRASSTSAVTSGIERDGRETALPDLPFVLPPWMIPTQNMYPPLPTNHGKNYPPWYGMYPQCFPASDEDETVEDNTLPANVASVSVKALTEQAVEYYAKKLDVDTEERNEDFVCKNWQGLAEYMGIEPSVTEYISKVRESKTKCIFDKWKNSGHHTIGELWELIRKIDREDVLKLERVYNRTKMDAEIYERKQQEMQHHNARRKKFPFHRKRTENEIEEESILLDPEEALRLRRSNNVDENEVLVRQDVGLEPGSKKVMFDAYISFSDKNMTFIREVINFLEVKHKLKLCIKERDLLPGTSEYYAVAHLIAHRCRKMIVLMSPDYMKSHECDFQSKVALSLNRTQILVMYQQTEVPPAINFMCLLRYHDMPAPWFWNRMHKAVMTENKNDIFPPCSAGCKQHVVNATDDPKTVDAIPKPLRKILQCVGIRKTSKVKNEVKDRVRLKRILRHRAVCSACKPHQQCDDAVKIAHGAAGEAGAEHAQCACGEYMSCPKKVVAEAPAAHTAANIQPAAAALCDANQDSDVTLVDDKRSVEKNAYTTPVRPMKQEADVESRDTEIHTSANLSTNVSHVEESNEEFCVDMSASSVSFTRTSKPAKQPKAKMEDIGISLLPSEDGPKGLVSPDKLFDPNECKKYFGPNVHPRHQPQLVDMTHPGSTFMMPEAHLGNHDYPLLGGKYAYYIPYVNKSNSDARNICKLASDLEKKKACCGAAESNPAAIQSTEHSANCDNATCLGEAAAHASTLAHSQDDMTSARRKRLSSEHGDEAEVQPLLSDTVQSSGIGLSEQMTGLDLAEPAVKTKSTVTEASKTADRYGSRDSGVYESEFIRATKKDTGYDVMNPFRRPTKEEWTKSAMTKRLNEISGHEMQALRMHQIYMEEMRKHHLKAVSLAYQQCQKELHQQPLQAVPHDAMPEAAARQQPLPAQAVSP